MKYLLITLLTLSFTGCASKSHSKGGSFDQKAYDRQNNAAEKSLDSI